MLPGALAIPKPNMPEHVLQTYVMTPVLYEVLTDAHGRRAARRHPTGGAMRWSAASSSSPGQDLRSPDGRYRLTYQTDGNLVV